MGCQLISKLYMGCQLIIKLSVCKKYVISKLSKQYYYYEFDMIFNEYHFPVRLEVLRLQVIFTDMVVSIRVMNLLCSGSNTVFI